MQTLLNSFDRHAFALEQSEASYWGKLYESPVLDLRPSKLTYKGATACALPKIPILAMNRVLGWGWDKTTSASDLSYFIEFYQSQECNRFMVQLSPMTPHYDQLVKWLEGQGFRRHNRWAKLWRPIIGYTPMINTFLKLKRINEIDAEVYGQILKESFEWDYPQIDHWLSNCVGKPGCRHYLVYHDEQAIAAGALHLEGEYASMAFAATLPQFRGMGAQSLLLYHRCQEAYREGAKYLIAETAEDRPDRPVTSFRNMQKFGFDLAYYRDNWIWERE